MLMARSKAMIVILLALVFTGQALASAKLSCQNQSSEQMISSDMADHSQHFKMDSSSSETMSGFECCPSCDCNLGGCTTIAILPTVQSPFVVGVVSLASHHVEFSANHLAVSLFRPPISR